MSDEFCKVGAHDGDLSQFGWLDEVYLMCHEEKIDDAIDTIFSHISRMLCVGDFAKVDEVLKAVDKKKINVDVAIAFLSITLSVSDQLPSRGNFISMIKALICESHPDRINELLGGLY